MKYLIQNDQTSIYNFLISLWFPFRVQKLNQLRSFNLEKKFTTFDATYYSVIFSNYFLPSRDYLTIICPAPNTESGTQQACNKYFMNEYMNEFMNEQINE